jgi:hypothetical protein
MENAFEVDEASPITTNRWQVKGRASRQIEVGDTLFGAVGRTYEFIIKPDRVDSILHEPEGGPTLYPFQIVAILTYGRELDLLGRGMTGTITLEGEHGETLMDTKYLVVLDEQSTG